MPSYFVINTNLGYDSISAFDLPSLNSQMSKQCVLGNETIGLMEVQTILYILITFIVKMHK